VAEPTLEPRGSLEPGWARPVERTSVADVVYVALRDAVVDGRLAPATRLGEKELATQFRVSRTPVREALRRLEQRRLVGVLPTGGYQVTDWDPSDVRDLYRVRSALERLVAGEAAVRASPDDLASLAREVERPPAAADGGAGGAARQFHQVVARIAGIRLATDLLDDIADHEDRYRRRGGSAAERPQRVHDEHRHILAEIGSGSRERAERAMAEHLEHAGALVLQVFADEVVGIPPLGVPSG